MKSPITHSSLSPLKKKIRQPQRNYLNSFNNHYIFNLALIKELIEKTKAKQTNILKKFPYKQTDKLTVYENRIMNFIKTVLNTPSNIVSNINYQKENNKLIHSDIQKLTLGLSNLLYQFYKEQNKSFAFIFTDKNDIIIGISGRIPLDKKYTSNRTLIENKKKIQNLQNFQLLIQQLQQLPKEQFHQFENRFKEFIKQNQQKEIISKLICWGYYLSFYSNPDDNIYSKKNNFELKIDQILNHPQLLSEIINSLFEFNKLLNNKEIILAPSGDTKWLSPLISNINANPALPLSKQDLKRLENKNKDLIKKNNLFLNHKELSLLDPHCAENNALLTAILLDKNPKHLITFNTKNIKTNRFPHPLCPQCKYNNPLIDTFRKKLQSQNINPKAINTFFAPQYLTSFQKQNNLLNKKI